MVWKAITRFTADKALDKVLFRKVNLLSVHKHRPIWTANTGLSRYVKNFQQPTIAKMLYLNQVRTIVSRGLFTVPNLFKHSNCNVLPNLQRFGQTNKSFVLRNFSVSVPNSKRALITVTYSKSSGEKITVQGKEGDNLLDVVVNNNVDLDGYGACEGTLACSTCHLVFSKDMYDKLPEPPTDEELDMLDLAYGLTDTSRLGCQVCLAKDLDGMEVHVPAGVNDAREPSN